jgi:hypothetical protein
MPSRPYARSAELIVEKHNDELLVYDRRSEVAHCLTSVAALVWQHCDGQTELDALVALVAAREPGGDAEELTLRALGELDEKRLLDVAYEGRSVLSRRQAVQRLAGAGMAALSVPLVVSAVVPSAAAAASPPCQLVNQPCTSATNNQNGNCCGTVLCTTGNAGPTAQKYCNNNTSCVGQGQEPLGTGGNIYCAAVQGAAATCCSGQCNTGGLGSAQRQCL